MSSVSILKPKRVLRRKRAEQPTLREYPGRPVGRPKGSHLDNLIALRKALLLCWKCDHAFEERRHRYYRASGSKRRIPYAMGKCDACRETSRGSLYIHESYLVQDSRSQPGQCWRPD